MAFHIRNCVGTRDDRSFAVQWLACALPCRRFAGALADVCARLGADVDRYSFTVRDLHPLLLAGLPAHSETLHKNGPDSPEPRLPGYPEQRTSSGRPGWSGSYQSTKSLRSSPLRGGQESRGRELAERTALAGLRAPS